MNFFNRNWFGRKKPLENESQQSPEPPFPELTSEAEIAAEMLGIEDSSVKPDAVANEVASLGYSSSDEHLWDEFGRIDQLIHAQAQRWFHTIAEHKELNYWGMALVSRSEVEHYLRSEYVPQDRFPATMESALTEFWDRAKIRTQLIATRVSQKPPGVTLRLKRLMDLFDLASLDRDALLVCLLPQVDSRYRRLFAYLQDDASRTRPNVELVLEILSPFIAAPQAGRAMFDPKAPLLANHLLVLGAGPQGDESLLVRPVGVDDRIAGYLFGSTALDARLIGILSEADGPVQTDDLVLGDNLLEQIKRMAAWWRDEKAKADSQGAAFFLHGPEGSPVQKIARVIGGATQPLLEADAGAALRSPNEFGLVVQLAFREALLRGAALHWRGCEALLQQDLDPSLKPILQLHIDTLAAAAERFHGLTFFSSTLPWDPAGRFHDHPFLRLVLPVPAYSVREKLWKRSLKYETNLYVENMSQEALAGLLANSFQLTEGQLYDSLATARELARARDPNSLRLTIDDIFEGCRRQSGRGLAALARRLEPRSGLTFDDLKLPPVSRRQFDELRQRIRFREYMLTGLGFEQRLPLSLGLVVLFTGASGTGKTMAAELLAAKEMHVDLYKVDMSAVVSKYIGDTEKRLAELFDQAEEMNACLFIDEADALFGKRGDVKDASDRYANMQVNYLLQRIEDYSGVVILATNLRQNMDEAFMRRIHFYVDFPFPDERVRTQIWLGMFSEKLGRPGDEQIAALAKQFELNGGNIRNVVLAAAFRALSASEDKTRPEITMRDLVLSIEREYQKLGKPITRGAFGSEFYKFIEEEAEENRRAG